VTPIDWFILVFALLFAASGYLAGIIVSGLALGGFAFGAFAGSRIGPELLSGGSASPYAPLAAMVGGIVIGAMIASVAEAIGHVARRRLVRNAPVATVDGLGGAVVLAAFALALAWIAGAVALNTPALDSTRRDVQRSVILRWLNERLPPTGPVLNVLNRIDPTPSVPGPPVAVGPPGEGVVRDPDVEAAGASVVRVHGTACGLGIAGSGWVVGQRLVATNAHVVAGEDDTTVITRDGSELDAVPVHYSPRDDLALLAVEGLGLPVLPVTARAEAGAEAAVLGYPLDGPFTIAAARVGTTQAVISQDAYGRGPVRREMTSFRGQVISGNSGGPLVDVAGRVVATVFASTTSGPRGGLAVPNSVLEDALGTVSGEVDTGPCAA
jgi:S1-C subfamily serine protease